MNTTFRALLLTASVLAPPGTTQAGAAEWRVELFPTETEVSFTLKATLHTVKGTAELKSGSIVLDPETGQAEGEIVIDATSTATGNTSRDKKMHNKILLTGDHPLISLRPNRFDGQPLGEGSNRVVLHGEMTLLGIAHEIEIPLQIEITRSTFSATARFGVPFVQWGLEDPSTLILKVAKEVQIEVKTAGTITTGD